MRSVAVVTIAALTSGTLLAGCGAKYKPKEPVIDAWQRTMEYPPFVRSDSLQYLGGQPMTSAPVVPVMAFGAAFDLDLVAMVKSDQVDMLEMARITTPYGPMWMALESEPRNGEQTLVAKVVGDIDAWMPELPLARKNDPSFKVTDQSGPTQINLEASYEAMDGRIVETSFLGDPPLKPNKKRNGNTFEHSQSSLLAVLDVAANESLFKAKIQFDGKGQGLRKVAGVVPGQFALVQSQGGLAVGSYVITEGTGVDWSNGSGMVEVIDPNAAPPPPPPESVIQTAIATSIPALQACYGTALTTKPTLAGRFVVRFGITDGVLGYADRKDLGEGEGFLVDEAFEACIGDVFKGYTWPKASGAGTQELMFALPAAAGESASMTFGDFRFVERQGVPAEAMDGPLEMEDEGIAPEEKGTEASEAGTDEAAVKAAADKAAADKAAADKAAADKKPAADKPAADKPAADKAPAEEAPEGDPKPEEGGAEPEDGGADDDLMDLLGDEEPMPGMDMAEPEPVDPPLSDFTTTHAMRSGNLVKLPWQVSRQANTVVATQTSDMRELAYTYNVYGEALELSSITVTQYGHAVPVTSVSFSPALPDLRLRFNGRQTHRYVIDINGQQNHATGTVDVVWDEAGPKVRITPDAPEWTVPRALLSSIVYGGDGSVQVTTQRITSSN